MEKKGVRRRFFNKEFFQLMDLRQSAVDPEQRELARRKLRMVYASDDAIIFPFGEAAKKKRVNAEIRAFFKKTSAIELFFAEFLGREAI